MKYALRNLIRIPHRTVLMLVILSTVLLLLMWSVLAANLCTLAIADRLGPLGQAVRLTDGDLENPQGKPPLSLETLALIDEKFDVVTGHTGYYKTSFETEGVTYFKNENSDMPPSSSRKDRLAVYICSDMTYLPQVLDNEIAMVEGSFLTAEDNLSRAHHILISDALAEANGLGVGDEIALKMGVQRGETFSQEDVPFTISGIYRNNQPPSGSEMSPEQIVDNDLYLTYGAISDARGLEEVRLSDAYLMLARSDEATVSLLEARLEQLQGIRAGLQLEAYAPNTVALGITRLLTLARAACLLLVVCGLLATLVVIFLNLQSRTRELGVLTALGKTRTKTVNSFFFEIVAVGLLSLLAAAALFALTAEAGGELIGEFLASGAFEAEFANTNSDTIWAELGREHSTVALSAHLLRASGVALAALVLTVAAAYLLIRMYLKRLDILRVIGGGVE